MQKQRYHSDGSCQGRFANPRLAVQEHRAAPLLTCSGILRAYCQLINGIGIRQPFQSAATRASCGAEPLVVFAGRQR